MSRLPPKDLQVGTPLWRGSWVDFLYNRDLTWDTNHRMSDVAKNVWSLADTAGIDTLCSMPQNSNTLSFVTNRYEAAMEPYLASQLPITHYAGPPIPYIPRGVPGHIAASWHPPLIDKTAGVDLASEMRSAHSRCLFDLKTFHSTIRWRNVPDGDQQLFDDSFARVKLNLQDYRGELWTYNLSTNKHMILSNKYRENPSSVSVRKLQMLAEEREYHTRNLLHIETLLNNDLNVLKQIVVQNPKRGVN